MKLVRPTVESVFLSENVHNTHSEVEIIEVNEVAGWRFKPVSLALASAHDVGALETYTKVHH